MIHVTFLSSLLLFFNHIFLSFYLFFSTLTALQKPLSSSISLSTSNSNSSLAGADNGDNSDIPIRTPLKVTPRENNDTLPNENEVESSVVVEKGDTRDNRLNQLLSEVAAKVVSLTTDTPSPFLSESVSESQSELKENVQV